LVVVYVIIKPCFRKKSIKTKRQNIQFYVDKIEKSFAGKITIFKTKPESEHYPIPDGDISDFNNLTNLSNNAENLLSNKEMNSLHKLIKKFENVKYNCPEVIRKDLMYAGYSNGECLKKKSIDDIYDLAKKINDLIKEKMK
jgi:hypothetical protein